MVGREGRDQSSSESQDIAIFIQTTFICLVRVFTRSFLVPLSQQPREPKRVRDWSSWLYFSEDGMDEANS